MSVDFNKPKGYSSAVTDEHEGIGYQQGIPVSGITPIVGEKEVRDIEKTPAEAESQVGIDELVGGSQAVGRTNLPLKTQQGFAVEGVGEATSSVVKSTALQKSQTMSNSDSFQESQESDDVNLIGNLTPKPKSYSMYIKVGLLSFFLFGTALFGVSAAICMSVPQDDNNWEIIDTSEILQSNTILAYQGNYTQVQFKAKPETTEDLTLKAVDCQKLVRHTNPRNYTDTYPFTLHQPTFIPAQTENDRFELESTFGYTITPAKDIPEGSSLTIRMFDNIVEALNYKNDGTDSNARQKAYLNHLISSNMTSHFNFNPPFASYFLAAFDPNITGGTFYLDVSYNICQIFYDITDYVVPADSQCQLNSNKPCDFDFSDYDNVEMCVLAYNPSSLGAGINPVTLTVSTPRINTTKKITHHWLFPPLLSLTVIFAYCFLVMLCIIAYICCKRKKPSGYNILLPITDIQQSK